MAMLAGPAPHLSARGLQSAKMAASRRILLTTFGSLGDLHPYLALGQELARRGHQVTIATLALFRERVEAAGLHFHLLRGAIAEQPTPELMRRVLHSRNGVEYILRELVMPAFRHAYEDTLAAAEDADLLVAHPLTFATRLVAESRGLPWISTQLAPTGFLSAYDPPVLPGMGWLRRLNAGPAVYRLLFRLADRQTRRWLRPVDALQAELGLPEAGNPLFSGGHSPACVLALFSPLVAQPQPDWPPQAVITGFPFFDQTLTVQPALGNWLDDGPPPVIFTLGSSAVMTPGDFFRESAAAARLLGVRALLLGFSRDGAVNLADAGSGDAAGALAGEDPDIFAAPFASYAHVFPRGAAIVHQGGIGTTAEALRAGRPMLVVPFGVDQPDNAFRVERLGVARVLGRDLYKALRVARALRPLIESPDMTARAQQIGALIRAENGAATACDRIEQHL